MNTPNPDRLSQQGPSEYDTLSDEDLRKLINGGAPQPKATWREKMAMAWEKGSAADRAWFRDYIKPRSGRPA